MAPSRPQREHGLFSTQIGGICIRQANHKQEQADQAQEVLKTRRICRRASQCCLGVLRSPPRASASSLT